MLRTLKSLFGKKQKSARKARCRTFRPMIDTLEERRLLAVLFVDDNRQQFPTAQYTTIQAAVNAAQPGDTIKVFAGKYNEQVVVFKPGLTLIGAGTGPQFATNPQLASIIDPPASSVGYGIYVGADDTTVTGFTLGDIDDDQPNSAGIGTAETISGFTISGNVMTDSSMGVYLHSSGAKPSTLSGNWIYGNNDGPTFGHYGIYSFLGARNIQIVGNTITDQLGLAINFTAASVYDQDNIRIEGNTIGAANRAGSGSVIALYNLTNSRISNNTIHNSLYGGVFVGGDSSYLVISNNTIVNPAFTGIELANSFESGPTNTQIQVTGNRISGAGVHGIRLAGGTTNSVVSNNTVTGGRNTSAQAGHGIIVNGATGNLITGNTLTNNFGNGILVTAISTGNTFTSNVAVLNGNGVTTFDLTDLSTGPGTAGTANFWASNTAIRRNRPGL